MAIFGIAVIVIEPGFIDTRFQTNVAARQGTSYDDFEASMRQVVELDW